MNMTIDMRFIKSSDQIMSYVYDEDPEAIFCTIEIVSVAGTKDFGDFSAKVAQHWISEYNARYQLCSQSCSFSWTLNCPCIKCAMCHADHAITFVQLIGCIGQNFGSIFRTLFLTSASKLDPSWINLRVSARSTIQRACS